MELTDVEIETIRIIQERNEKGRETYGKGLDHRDNYDWLDMAIEEAADMLKYLVAEKLRRQAPVIEKWCGCGDGLRTDEDIKTGKCGICRSLE